MVYNILLQSSWHYNLIRFYLMLLFLSCNSQRYDLKSYLPGNATKFLAKFSPKPSGSVDIVGVDKQPAAGKNTTDNKYFRKSDRRSWIMYREGAEGKRKVSITVTCLYVFFLHYKQFCMMVKSKHLTPTLIFMPHLPMVCRDALTIKPRLILIYSHCFFLFGIRIWKPTLGRGYWKMWKTKASTGAKQNQWTTTCTTWFNSIEE